MPGNKTGQALPYFFDEVLALRVERDAEGTMQRALQCDSDGIWLAKDRSGRLGMWETADLGEVIRKITGQTEAPAAPFGKKAAKAVTKEDANETEPDATE
jgi:hypothetical protein